MRPGEYGLRQVFVPLKGSVSPTYAIGGLSACSKPPSPRTYLGSVVRDSIGSRRATSLTLSRKYKDRIFAFCSELHTYLHAHYCEKRLTIESVHRFRWIHWLKKVLDDKLCVFYVDISLSNRKMRSLETLEKLAAKEVAKTQRGADRVKAIADFTLKNNRSLRQSQQELKRYLRAADKNAFWSDGSYVCTSSCRL